MKSIGYKSGYKYQLVHHYVHQLKTIALPLDEGDEGGNEWVRLDAWQLLRIAAGYAWDGPSGPTIDTPSAMRGSLVHDALYQLIRIGVLDPSSRAAADAEYERICREDGMSGFRAWLHFNALRRFGGSAAEPGSEREVIWAP